MSAAGPRAIVLIGPMGAGKTSVGRRVARALEVDFADTDALVVRDHGPIPELFAEHGEPVFREWERAAVTEALGRGGVVALGGGAVLAAETRRALESHLVVLLTVAAHVVPSRIAGAGRPLLSGQEDPIEQWRRIYAERRAVYEEVADVTFDTSSGPLSGVVSGIVDWVRSVEAPEEES